MEELLDHVRRICLALPEASERETWGHPTFRVRDKIFASYGIDEPPDGSEPEEAAAAMTPPVAAMTPPVAAMTMKAPAGEQDSLLAEGLPFFYPKYVGSKGWIGVVVDSATDWDEVAELVEDSFRLVAPKRLTAELDRP